MARRLGPPEASAEVSSCRAGGWRRASVGSVSEASDLLDRLEACGARERSFAVLGESSFEVRWR